MYPEDSVQRKIGDRARQIVHYQLDVEHWVFKEETGSDVGRDCILELSENDQFLNHKVEGQIKGTNKPEFVAGAEFVSFPLEVKTINYALSATDSFILFVVDVINEVVYFQCIQDYFKDEEKLLEKLSKQKTINVRIPTSCTLRENDELLRGLALRSHYRDGFLKMRDMASVRKEAGELIKC